MEKRLPKQIPPTLYGRTIRCILFDFGDTLWTRKDKATWYQLEQAANQNAVTILRTHFSPAALPALDDSKLGLEIRRAVDHAIREKKRQDPEHEPNFITLVQEALRGIGILHVNLTLSEAIFEALRVRIQASRDLFDDTLSTLTALRERGYTLGVVTNRHYGGLPFQEDLRDMGLLNYFDVRHMAISADLRVRKPNPAIFLHALDGLGFSPQEAAMVGDSLTADVGGAKRLNLFAVWMPKSHLIAEARAAHLASTSTIAEETYARAEAELKQQAKHLPLDMDSSDDDFLVAYARGREGKRKYALQLDTRPDLIIEHLSDLLDFFVGENAP
jgi:HAD superfamily hydrolase (TIGR01549 family)